MHTHSSAGKRGLQRSIMFAHIGARQCVLEWSVFPLHGGCSGGGGDRQENRSMVVL